MNLTPRYEVVLLDDPKVHLYQIKGEPAVYKSVTHYLEAINKPALLPWARKQAVGNFKAALYGRLAGKDKRRIELTQAWIDAAAEEAGKVPDRIKDDAANLGSLCHEWYELFKQGRAPEVVPENIRIPVEAFLAWRKEAGFEFLLGDTKVASRLHGYGGAFDSVVRWNGEIVLIDYKTSNGIWPEYALQTAAYWQAFAETYGVLADKLCVVRFGKDKPTFEWKMVADIKACFEAFLASKRLKETVSPKVFARP